jgi:hypothetical protein
VIPQPNDIGTAPGTGSTGAPSPGEAPTTAAPSSGGAIGPVIDLRDGPTTRVRIARHENPFARLSPPERMRLIIRVLCELVAYDELENTEEHQRTIRAAMDVTEARAARPGPRAASSPRPAAPGATSGAPSPGAPTSVSS